MLTIALMQEHNERLGTELSHSSLKLDVHRLATLGSPGYTRTDWTEGTEKDIVLKRIGRHEREVDLAVSQVGGIDNPLRRGK